MPSPVSMPPNIITAAFDTTSAGLSVAVASARTPSPCRSCSRHVARACAPRPQPGADLATDGDPIDGGDDLVVPAQDRGRLGVEQVKGGRDDLDRQRPGQITADLGTTSGCERSDERPCGVLDACRNRAATSGLWNAVANGSRCLRCSVPSSESMLGPTTCAVENRGSSTVKWSRRA